MPGCLSFLLFPLLPSCLSSSFLPLPLSPLSLHFCHLFFLTCVVKICSFSYCTLKTQTTSATRKATEASPQQQASETFCRRHHLGFLIFSSIVTLCTRSTECLPDEGASVPTGPPLQSQSRLLGRLIGATNWLSQDFLLGLLTIILTEWREPWVTVYLKRIAISNQMERCIGSLKGPDLVRYCPRSVRARDPYGMRTDSLSLSGKPLHIQLF